jgi:DNA primase large subunit
LATRCKSSGLLFAVSTWQLIDSKSIIHAAERLNLTPSEFAREALLTAANASVAQRLLLAKSCKIEAMLQLFFGGLFAQLNQNEIFEEADFQRALEVAEAAQFRKVEEHMTKYAIARKEAAHA